MKRRLGLFNKPSGGAFDPTSIPNCVSWIDLSDDSYMTFTGAAVDTYTDKVNGAVHTKISASNEYQWATTHLLKLDLQPKYNSVYSSSIACSNYTFLVLFQQTANLSGTIHLNESWSSSYYLSRSSGSTIRWRPTGGADTYTVTGFSTMSVPKVFSVTGGVGESQTILRVDNVSDATRTESKGISLGTSTYSMASNTDVNDLRPYQVVVYDRVLTTQELIDIHDWLDTKT